MKTDIMIIDGNPWPMASEATRICLIKAYCKSMILPPTKHCPFRVTGIHKGLNYTIMKEQSGTENDSNTTLSKGHRQFVHFAAVNYEAIVFVNGKEVGKHVGGFTPFNFEVTGLLRSGENSSCGESR
jgi:hypothetical protein